MSALALVTRPTGQDTDDLDLVARVRAGDDRAFELLFLRYQARIASYVGGMVHDHGRAEDITQEIFMSALRRIRATDREIAFKPWIYEIAKNACIDAYRRGRNTHEVSFDAQDALGVEEHDRLAVPGATPDALVEGKVAFDNLCGAFGGLSQTHHEILVMREFEGLTYREIGERLGMSRPAVESTLFRARRRLSEEYEELVSGERCLRVQRIVDASSPSAGVGRRDRRRLDRHLAHCQPCRRYARLAGFDLDTRARPAAAASTAARIAAFFPLPLVLRRRVGGDETGQVLGAPGVSSGAPMAQWSASVGTTLDPGLVSGWCKAAATAATMAVAGVGAGTAIQEARSLQSIFTGGPQSVPAASKDSSDRRAGTRSGAGGALVSVGGSRAVRVPARPRGVAPSDRRSTRKRVTDPGPGSRRRGGVSGGEPAASGGGASGAPIAPAPAPAQGSGPERPADSPLGGDLPLGLTPPGGGGGSGAGPVERLIETVGGLSPPAGGGSAPAAAREPPDTGAVPQAGAAPVDEPPVGAPVDPKAPVALPATGLTGSVDATVSGTLATTTKTLSGR